LAEAGIDVTLIASPDAEFERLAGDLPQVRCIPLRMERAPAPLRDLKSLFQLIRLLREGNFDVVHSTGPKGGLLAALAARAAGAPLRLHTYTGQVWAALDGPVRWMTRESDRVVARLSTHLYADSHSQREFLIAEGLVPAAKIKVLGAGSVSGVDLDRFSFAHKGKIAARTRDALGIPLSAVVISFVGRLTRDKGVGELVSAFDQLAGEFPDAHLMLVGPQEPQRDPLPATTLAAMAANPRIHALGYRPDPETYLAASDVFCLPSHREGFGSAAIEAAALGLPTVGTRITGLTDAVADGVTGILGPAKDTAALAAALRRLLSDPPLRQRMGAAALDRVRQHFDGRFLSRLQVEEYRRLAIQRSPDSGARDAAPRRAA
jgi:glycosyltransferase involved in cell wall biosynthesis